MGPEYAVRRRGVWPLSPIPLSALVARHAGEMIGRYTALMTHKLGLGALTRVMQPYPGGSGAQNRRRIPAHPPDTLRPKAHGPLVCLAAWALVRAQVVRSKRVRTCTAANVIAVHSSLCYAEAASWAYGGEAYHHALCTLRALQSSRRYFL
jgi:hypothetical protein